MSIIQLTAKELQEKLQSEQKVFILDVREKSEYDIARIDGSSLIPLSLLPLKVDELDKNQDTVVLCHHGVRSMMACRYLEGAGFTRLYNLLGGINAWSLECDESVPQY